MENESVCSVAFETQEKKTDIAMNYVGVATKSGI